MSAFGQGETLVLVDLVSIQSQSKTLVACQYWRLGYLRSKEVVLLVEINVRNPKDFSEVRICLARALDTSASNIVLSDSFENVDFTTSNPDYIIVDYQICREEPYQTFITVWSYSGGWELDVDRNELGERLARELGSELAIFCWWPASRESTFDTILYFPDGGKKAAWFTDKNSSFDIQNVHEISESEMRLIKTVKY